MDTMRVTAADDAAYVRANYVDIESACREAGYDLPSVNAQIARGERAGPAYVLADGTRFVPWDYFEQVTGERNFIDRVQAQTLLRGVTLDGAQLDEIWNGYLRGTYGICLRHATPENIVDKQWLIGTIESLLHEPAVEDGIWLARLHDAVDALDEIEREFCAFDRIYFGRPVSRDTYVTDVRARYPRAITV
ncbi:MAG: DUF6058 family natural product biosynthesis protein [Vulcanimicrobiaceae bacterium]